MYSKRSLLVFVVAALALGITPANAQDTTINGFVVTYDGRAYDGAANQTTFTYTVAGTGAPPALSHFTAAVPACEPTLTLVAFSPVEGVSLGGDPTTGLDGVKWDMPLEVDATQTYTLTFQGEVAEGVIQVAVKGGDGFETGEVPGPACEFVSIDVEKFVSVDGATWLEADAAPGPVIEPGSDVWFRFVVTNDGNFELTDLSLTDNVLDLSVCELPASLASEEWFACEVGPIPAVEGQHTNTATASGAYEGAVYQASDDANYFGGDPSVPPPVVVGGGECPLTQGFWKNHPNDWPVDSLVLGNYTYTQAELLTIFHTPPAGDASLILAHQLIATKLNVANGAAPAVESTIAEADALLAAFDGPLPYGAPPSSDTGQAMVAASEILDQYNNGSFTPDCEEGGSLLVIEGPVVSIEGNIVVIGDVTIWIDPDDPFLVLIRVGDHLHIRGRYEDREGIYILVAVVVIFSDVEVVLPDSIDWTPYIDIESGDWNCNNPPPPWAPAHGWRAKCEDGVHPSNKNKDK